MRFLILASLLLLSACGGGGDAQVCTQDIKDSFSMACPFSINPSSDAVIVVQAQVIVHAHNGTSMPLRLSRWIDISFDGDAYSVINIDEMILPGQSVSIPVSLEHTFSGGDTANRPISIGISSLDRFPELGSTITVSPISYTIK